MNLKMYSRALRVRRMGSHCSPRLDTSRYLFNTDISFLEGNDKTEREMFHFYFDQTDKSEQKRRLKEQRTTKNE